MRKILFLVCLLGLPCVSLAQLNQTSWANLSVLHSGQKIQIIDTASKKHSGTFSSVSETAISFTQTASEKSIQKQDVRTVRLMENKHRLRNTLLVGAAGAGVGAAIGAATHKSCSTQSFCIDVAGKALPAGIGAVIGGIGGAAVGALLPSHSTIYDITSH
jgi:hypothetical protein